MSQNSRTERQSKTNPLSAMARNNRKYQKFAGTYLEELAQVFKRLPLEPFSIFIDWLLEAYHKEREIFVMGNGGSAATASHFAHDINKGVSYGLEKRFRILCLNDNVPVMLAYANDLTYELVFVEQLKNFLKPRDLVIGFSSSGNSKNVIRAIRYGKEKGARTVGLSGFQGGELVQAAEFSWVVPSDDVQKIEDMHLVFSHMVMQILKAELHSERAGHHG